MRLATAALAALALLLLAGVPAALACPPQRWVASWLANPSDAATGGFQNQTLRTIVTPHLGGTQLRLHLSNRFGTQPVTFDRVVLARRASGAAVVPGTSTPVTFGGQASVTVPGGLEAVSDPVTFSFDAFQDLAVSMAFSDGTGPATEHFVGRQTSYATDEGAGGDHTSDTSDDAFSRLASTAHFFLTGIDVLAPGHVGAVATFGDSITDGYEGSPSPLAPNLEGIDANGAYPDQLQRRLLLTPGAPALAVVNAGITGNRILQDGLIPQHGIRGVERLRPDALAQAGVTDLIVLEGINDLGARSADASQVIAGLANLVAQGRAAGLNVLLGTLTPAGGSLPDTYGDAATEAERQQINGWIRTAGAADGVVDFDAALRDPQDPSRLAARYDSGDHLHPNLAGYRAMADAIDLARLHGTGCAAPRACPAQRTVTLHVPTRYRKRLRRVTVTVNGRRAGAATRRRAASGLRISFRTATATVRLRMVLSGGRTVTQTRRLVRCTAAARAHGHGSR